MSQKFSSAARTLSSGDSQRWTASLTSGNRLSVFAAIASSASRRLWSSDTSQASCPSQTGADVRFTSLSPERAERRRKSPKWEDRAIRNLAKAGLQNGIAGSDKVTYRRIAERARLLTHVPENRWGEVVWFEEEE